MLILFILLGEVISQESTEKTDTCFLLIRHFFNHADEELTLMFTTLNLDQDRLTKKLVADLFFNCIDKISESDIPDITSSDYIITDEHADLLGFDSEKYKTEQDLEVTPEQAQFLSELLNPSQKQQSKSKPKPKSNPTAPKGQGDSFFSFWLFYVMLVVFAFGGLIYCGFSLTQGPKKPTKKDKKSN